MKILWRFWLWVTKPAELVDWLGEGAKAVSSQEAARRAGICFGCPNNKEGSLIVVEAAAVIKNRLGLKVEGEENLHSCVGCGCYLPLKIWVNYEHIKAWQKQSVADEIRKVEPNCWQL